MSRSVRKAIVKDRPRNSKKSSDYWRSIRSVINNKVRVMKYDPEIELPEPQTIVNDYDYSDYKYDVEYHTGEKYEEDKRKLRRK